MNKYDRKMFSFTVLSPDCIGIDHMGREIKEGMIVEVVVAEEPRCRMPEFAFCGVGCRGRASKHFTFPMGWVTTVHFGEQSVGCVDYYLRIVGQ